MPANMCPDKKRSGGQNVFRQQASTPEHHLSTTQEHPTRENELVLKNSELLEKNAQLAQEVQKLKLYNGQILKNLMELKKKNVEASIEIVRLKEVCNRISVEVKNFLPFMIRGTEFLECVLKESESANNETVCTTLELNNVGSVEDCRGGSPPPVSPSRTGIARPIIQGHTIISKPSISLQRVVPRETVTSYVPVPVSALNLDGLVRGDEEAHSLSDVSEEDADGSREDREDDNRPADRSEAGHEASSGRESVNSSVLPEASDSPDAGGTVSRASLSVIVEQSPVLWPAQPGPSTSPASAPQATRSRRDETPVNGTAKRSRAEEAAEEEAAAADSSDDEAVELSLIESRCKLMNGDRRKELKEGTSRDYDAKGNFSPHSRRKRKRQRKREDKGESPARAEDETSALRKSVSGLLNSLKKKRSRLSDGRESPASSASAAAANGASEDLSVPRVSLTRLGSWRQSVGLVPPSPVPPSPVPPSPMPMVSKRKRGPYVTTRNKRSRHAPSEDEAEEATEPKEDPPRRSGKMRISWAELLRRRSRSQEDEEDEEGGAEEEESCEGPAASAPAMADLSGRTPEELTILLSRCSESFIAQNTSHRSNARQSLNDSQVPTAHLAPPDASDGKSPNESASRRTKSKARSKPTRLPKAPKATKANGKVSQELRTSKGSASSSFVDDDSSLNSNSLYPSSINSSAASLVASGDKERDSCVISPSRSSVSGRPRRVKAPTTLKEMSLNKKLRRT